MDKRPGVAQFSFQIPPIGLATGAFRKSGMALDYNDYRGLFVVISYQCNNRDCAQRGMVIPWIRTRSAPDGVGRICPCGSRMVEAETQPVSGGPRLPARPLRRRNTR